MATKTKKKPEKGSELLESHEALAEQLSRGEEFIEKNKKIVFIIGGVLAVVVAGFFLFKYYKETQNQQANAEVFQAQYYFEQDSLSKALNGDGNNLGFLEIIEEYPMSDAANLSHFYAGAILLRQGQFDDAVDHLQRFSSSDLLLQARAYCLIGDAYMEQGLYSDAAKQYDKAASYKTNEFTSPYYFYKAAIAYEKMGDTKAAIKNYDVIADKYKSSSEYASALKHSARLKKETKTAE